MTDLTRSLISNIGLAFMMGFSPAILVWFVCWAIVKVWSMLGIVK